MYYKALVEQLVFSMVASHCIELGYGLWRGKMQQKAVCLLFQLLLLYSICSLTNLFASLFLKKWDLLMNAIKKSSLYEISSCAVYVYYFLYDNISLCHSCKS